MSEIEIKMFADRSKEPSAQCQNVFVNFYSQNFYRLGATIYIESNKEGTELNFMINGKLVCTLREPNPNPILPDETKGRRDRGMISDTFIVYCNECQSTNYEIIKHEDVDYMYDGENEHAVQTCDGFTIKCKKCGNQSTHYWNHTPTHNETDDGD